MLAGVVLAGLGLVGCSGGDDGRAGPSVVTATAPQRSTTTERQRAEVTVTTSTATTTTTAPAPTTRPEGLPSSFPVPPNGVMTLSGDSTFAQTVDIRGVELGAVFAWAMEGLLERGYGIADDDGERSITFIGDGCSGTIDLIDDPDGAITARVVLRAPLG